MKVLKLILLNLLMFSQCFAQDIDKEIAYNLIKSNASSFFAGFKNEEIPVVTNAYKDEKTGLTFIYFQQQYQGIKVLNQIQSATFSNNQLLYKSRFFIKDIATKITATSPTVTAKDAVLSAANNLELTISKNVDEVDNKFIADKKITFLNAGISKRNIKTVLLFKPDNSNGKIYLVWCVSIAPIGTQDNWNVNVDALTGKVLDKVNETVYEGETIKNDNHYTNKICNVNSKQNNVALNFLPPPTTTSAVYNVVKYPNEHRFTNGIAVESNPWLKAGAGNNAITNGWHFDGTTNYNITRGNNVFAYDDSLNKDSPGRVATSKTALPSLDFNFTPDFTKVPTTKSNREFATTNLFYWNNLMHDVTYQYGFTEAAGNFQADNIGRGGLGNDMVMAEAQDGGGVNNANFWAQPDGDTARMQMYLFDGALNLKVLSPAGIAGSYFAKQGSFSINNLLKNIGPKTGQVVFYNDDAAGNTHNACVAANNNLFGKIALIVYAQQSGCTFVQRVKNAQDAGAIGVIVVYTTNKPLTMGGSDNTITIPAVMIGINDGNKIVTQLTLGNTVNATLQEGLQFDGDIDNGVVCHEYTHGISIRLTGGAANSSCLNNAEQAGEGWSDYLALMMTTNWATATINDGTISRTIGIYAFNQNPSGYGIRTYPYTTDMSVNPHTYSNVAVYGEVHYIGEIWCAAVWDMTWAIIQQENAITPNLYNSNATGGNVVAMNLVMLGLKLQPCLPGFLDARDAILAADDILYNGRHKCTIWKVFARRGMGYSAIQGSSNSTSDQVAAFDEPGGVRFNKNSIAAYNVAPSTTALDYNVKASCFCKSSNNNKVKVVLPAGLAYTSSSGGVSNADSIVFKNINFSTAFQTDSLALKITATATGCALDSVINDNRDGKTIGGFVSNAISGTSNWAATTANAHSPVTSWLAPDETVETEFTLTSNNFNPGQLSLLSFWHLLDLEAGYDGGIVEISANGGTTWQNIDNSFLQNGYNSTIAASTTLINQKAFTGSNNGSFQNSIANLSKSVGSSIKLRFRVATDIENGGNFYNGWYVDDIAVVNGCGNFVKFYLYDSANNLMDSLSVPVFITPKPLPVKIAQFIAKPVGKTSLLNWLVAEQVNVKNYVVERSIDGNNFNEIGTVVAQNNGSLEYLFYDKKPNAGFNYYRIKAIDFNGAINYSTIQKVSFSDVVKNELLIVPNPSKSSSKIYFPANFVATEIKVFDVMGKLVLSDLSNNGINTYFNINTTSLQQGTYLVNVYNKLGEVLTEKLVVAK